MPVPDPQNTTSEPGRRRGERLAADVALVALLLPVTAIAAADAVNPQWSWIEHMASHFVHGRAGWRYQPAWSPRHCPPRCPRISPPSGRTSAKVAGTGRVHDREI
ncbi:hypothetical protein [Verrucosispora sp. WMMD573]|uniref:hypothetical protein n=1 Tax=Verrucosispora sp. WMMD573 TaxID=3015149 RepID=UPI00248C53AB|nr:hypothetical protein [Verrucosispora sp. WMMD573]WBB52873.1 hypothetical protein O7601_20125 [Verrucosispora sp. WMMD573]